MKKIKNRKAFTLVEMLCVIIVIVLMTAVFAAAINLAVESYDNSVMRSENELLTSTLMTVISDELRYAGNTRVDAAGQISSIFSQKFGSLSGGFSLSDGRIMLGEHALLADKAYTYGQKVSAINVIYHADEGVFSVSFSITHKGSVLSAKEFSVKPINAVKIIKE